MVEQTIPALLRRERLLVRLTVALFLLLVLTVGGLLWVTSQALTGQQASRAAATRRIDMLTAKVDASETQRRADAVLAADDRATTAAARAGLQAKVDALVLQVQELCRGRTGCAPVVALTSSRTTPTSSPSPSTPTAPPPAAATTTSTTVAPTTPTTATPSGPRCLALNLPPGCS